MSTLQLVVPGAAAAVAGVAGAPIVLAHAAEASGPDQGGIAAMLLDPPAPRPERAVFEVRVYSIDQQSFGEVMVARRWGTPLHWLSFIGPGVA